MSSLFARWLFIFSRETDNQLSAEYVLYSNGKGINPSPTPFFLVLLHVKYQFHRLYLRIYCDVVQGILFF